MLNNNNFLRDFVVKTSKWQGGVDQLLTDMARDIEKVEQRLERIEEKMATKEQFRDFLKDSYTPLTEKVEAQGRSLTNVRLKYAGIAALSGSIVSLMIQYGPALFGGR